MFVSNAKSMRNRLFYLTGILVFSSLFITELSFAQRRKKKEKDVVISIYDVDTLTNPIPLQRQLWHNRIDEAQALADRMDGMQDGKITYVADPVYTSVLTQAIMQDVDHYQVMIENMPIPLQGGVSEGQVRIGYLSNLVELMRKYNQDAKSDPVYWRRVVNNFRELVIAKQENRLYDYVVAHPDIYTMANSQVLDADKGAKAYVFVEVGRSNPKMMIKRLSEFANEPFADEIIGLAARVVPHEIYNYASSTNYTLSGAVRRSKDPLVQSIVRIADESKVPLKAMPFLSDIYNKRKTIAEIDKITADPDLFYKNLVRLKLEGETLGGDTYTNELQYRGLKYVRDMNDLHTEKDPIRFKGIDGFKPEELYFIMVYGQDEIYTSSFVGTFNRMMERMGDSVKGGDLLDKVRYDKFRTFIRMCAGYNTLSQFLTTMTPDKKLKLMSDFIAGLEKGKEEDLEDAVDVADAFGSIEEQELLNFLQKEVKINYEHSYKVRSMKGMRVYALLTTLFNGLKASDNQKALQKQSEILSLPPINLVPYKNLVDDSGVVYQQVFFYGDEDGKTSFSSFLGSFRDGKWKITPSKYWTVINSTAGKPTVIYANNPLPEPEDEEAQKELSKFLDSKNIHPTIVIHRGHSYHLPLTLERLNKYARVVMLGSCGGYHNLGTVLDLSPDAHIISSKQTGAMNVNEQIIKLLNAKIVEGKDIDWINMWQDLSGYFTTKLPKYKDTFDDYVPPHKNLGAIFIKAYRRLSGSEEPM